MSTNITNLFLGARKLNDEGWNALLGRCLDDQDFLMEAVSDLYGHTTAYHIEEDELLMMERMNMPDADNDAPYIELPDSDNEQPQNRPSNMNFEEQNQTNTRCSTQANRNLSNEVRTQIITKLFKLANSKYELPKKAISNLATEYGKHRTTIARLWESAVKDDRRGEGVTFNHKMNNCGRKRKEIDIEMIKAVPQSKRTTIRQFATSLQVCPATVQSMMRRGIIRSHTSSIKPTLKPHHKIARLDFILQKIIPGTVREAPKFTSLTNVVHIDEKNFMATRQTQRYYLVIEEREPYRHTQSKNFIEKVMFMAAIARPLFGRDGECIFDGKIGIWPFTEDCVAVRSTSNRPRGTVVTKPARSVTKETIREMLISKLLPALKAKWPEWQSKCIWIQQDNARPHISPDDNEFCLAANRDGFQIKLMNQPAQSPDLNILDLGFFNAIQAIQYKKFPNNVNELIKSVEDAYLEYPPTLIKFTWLQLQYVMLEILKSKGGNDYKNPHKSKEKLERLGLLPFTVEVPQTLIDETVNVLDASVENRRNAPLLPSEVA